jgi:hypothetical protein
MAIAVAHRASATGTRAPRTINPGIADRGLFTAKRKITLTMAIVAAIPIPQIRVCGITRNSAANNSITATTDKKLRRRLRPLEAWFTGAGAVNRNTADATSINTIKLIAIEKTKRRPRYTHTKLLRLIGGKTKQFRHRLISTAVSIGAVGGNAVPHADEDH